MKTILYFIFAGLIFTACIEAQKPNYHFNNITLGGKNINGNLYQKRYQSADDSSIKYEKWKGKKVSTNEELEALLQVDPNCEALYFDFWIHDTLKNMVLTDKIGDFKNLKYLEIHSNRITQYPKSLEKLTKLKELILHVSQKRTIEFSFSNFKDLKYLTIHFAGHLVEFPSTVFDCSNLESFKLFRFRSEDKNVLKGIEKLKKLKELNIWDTYLFLPDVEYDFPKLETLVFDRSRQKIPDYFYNSQTLKNFSWGTMFDTIDLDKISRIKNLENLNLHFVRDFKGDLNLKKLEHLDITNYIGTTMNIQFDQLPALESLVFWSCGKLKSLDNISNNNLRSITIINNQQLESVFFDHRNLKSLEEVTMRANKVLKNKPSKVNNVLVQENRKR